MVAPVAWQLDVRGLQIIHWQGHASTGQLPFLFFFVFFFLGYREDVHSMQAARPTKIPDEPMLCETPALSR